MATPIQASLNASISADGWLSSATKEPSPNFSQRPSKALIELLVVHNISLPPGEYGGPYIQDFFCNKLDASIHPYFPEICDLKVSAHCLVRRNGEIIQFVSFDDRAWHAGRSNYKGREECNDYSVGIELEGTDSDPYTPAQYQSLVKIACLLQQRYPSFSADNIAGHCDIAPDRKTDPGPSFDWVFFRDLLDQSSNR